MSFNAITLHLFKPLARIKAHYFIYVFLFYIYIYIFILFLFVKCYLHAFRYCILGILGILYTFTFMYVSKAPESNFN